jgi:hypothetical protein
MKNFWLTAPTSYTTTNTTETKQHFKHSIKLDNDKLQQERTLFSISIMYFLCHTIIICCMTMSLMSHTSLLLLPCKNTVAYSSAITISALHPLLRLHFLHFNCLSFIAMHTHTHIHTLNAMICLFTELSLSHP